MPEVKRQTERLIGILAIGLVVLNYPLLSLFSKVKLLFGIPVLYFYIFAVWALFILCVALILEKSASSSKIDKSA